MMIVREVANEFKKALRGFDEEKMLHHMKKHYKTMRLIDEDGKWVCTRLQNISHELLPKDFNEKKSRAFVDEIAQISLKNPYLNDFLEKAKNEKFYILEKKLKEEGKEVLSDVVAYALVLERLTKAIAKEHKLMEDCVNIFQNKREELQVHKYMGLFHKVKLMSVEDPVKNLVLKSFKTGKVPENALSVMLPINILEATLGDFLMGNRDNAKAGWTLAINRPGEKPYDIKTGAGIATWQEDKTGLSFRMPLPKHWADLYQTWNMAFCSQIPNYPYVLSKLFIPQVSKYQDKPTHYIYNRALALYLHVNYAAFQSLDVAKFKESTIDWREDNLTKLWGKVNHESSRKYRNELARRRNLDFGAMKALDQSVQRSKQIETFKRKIMEGENAQSDRKAVQPNL
jgi:hypothetical protein